MVQWFGGNVWDTLLSAIALVFVLEGLLPFVFPKGWRSAMSELIQLDDRSLRWMGLSSMVLGLILLFIFT
ncbi:MAG: DUF2065 domain-containing protein [Hydrogenovibrio sp.]